VDYSGTTKPEQMITLQQLAETTEDPREALLLYIAAHGPVTVQDLHAFHRGEGWRVKKYLADLQYEGSIARNQSDAYVFVAWRRLARRRWPTVTQTPIAFTGDLVNALSPANYTSVEKLPQCSESTLAPSVEKLHQCSESTLHKRSFPTLVSENCASVDSKAPDNARDLSIDRSFDRIESNRVESSNSIRLDSKDSTANAVQKVQATTSHSDSALGYIEDKLCLPKMQRLRIEITGGNPHMSRKFVDLLHHKPEQLAEWIGEAASPAIADPCKFMNDRMSHALRP